MQSRSFAKLRADPPRLSPAERARLDARSDDDIDAAAAADEDGPEMNDDALARAAFARDVRLAREATGLTQAAFAECYRITLSRLRDWEQGRFKPDSVAAAYIRTIRHAPATVQQALAGAP